MVDDATHALLCALLKEAELANDFIRHPIHAWDLSTVERVSFPDGSTVIYKHAREPLILEDRALMLAASAGIPVPKLLSSIVVDHVLGMLMEDLGNPLREAGDTDAAEAAVALHGVGDTEALPVCDGTVLRQLPAQALRRLAALRDAGRWLGTGDLAASLMRIERVAPARVADAEMDPFGFCHSEFHPSSLHVGRKGWRLMDFARSFRGPGLLDLASWQGTTRPVDTPSLRDLIDAYVAAGGSSDAASPRGGLTAESWALGWHRIWIVEWYLAEAAQWIKDPAQDPVYIETVRRHLDEALSLLCT